MRERSIDHDAFEARQCDIQQGRIHARLMNRQLLAGPPSERGVPVAAGDSGVSCVAKLGGQVGDVNLTPRGHYRQPTTGVFQLPDVARPGQCREILLGFRV